MADNKPGVKITLQNGNLARKATTADGVAGIIVVGLSKPLLPNYTPVQIFSLKEIENKGITQANDVIDKVDAWQQIREFYDEAGNGAALWVMTVPMTRTMTEIMDKANTTNGARKLLDAADGNIRLLGIDRYISPTFIYAQVNMGGIDSDVHTALLKANDLALEYAENFKPFQFFIGARGWNGVASDLIDLRTYTYEKCSAMLGSTQAGKKSGAIGLLLGRYGRIPVQRNAGRVMDGGLNIEAGYFTDGTRIEDNVSAIDVAYDKGYFCFRKIQGSAEYFFVDDPAATVSTSDYLTVANNRVIDKARLLVYKTYIFEVNDEIEINLQDGKISANHVAYLKQIMTRALNDGMVTAGECSAAEVFLDPNQNVLSDDTIDIEVLITTVGYKKKMNISLGLKNPAK